MSEIYSLLKNKIEELKKNTKYFIAGKSQLGEDIIAFEIGSRTDKTILVQGSIHAREYITAFLLIEIIRYLKNFEIDGRVIIVPLANPDGVRICLEGYEFIEKKEQREIVKNILKRSDRKLYKANANGVDLNVNFDANWGQGASNFFDYPWYENYVGKYPNSEVEVRTLIDLTKKVAPFLTLSYHSKGNVIFYGFEGQSKKSKENEKKYLEVIVDKTGYAPIFTQNSTGGYKDYCLLKLDIIGFTIEVGNDYLSHPIGLEQLDSIFNRNKDLIIELLKVK